MKKIRFRLIKLSVGILHCTLLPLLFSLNECHLSICHNMFLFEEVLMFCQLPMSKPRTCEMEQHTNVPSTTCFTQNV